MSFPENDELASALPEEIRIRIQALAKKLNRPEPEVFKGLVCSLLDLIENPESAELTGLAGEVRKKFYSRTR